MTTRDVVARFYERFLAGAGADAAALFADPIASRLRATRAVYASMFFAHFTVRDGLIVRYRLPEDSHGLSVALGGRRR